MTKKTLQPKLSLHEDLLEYYFFAPFSNYFIARHFNVLHLLPFKVGNYARNFNRGRSREGALGAETPSLKINDMFCRYLLVASFPSLPLPPPLVSVEKSQVATHRLFTKNLCTFWWITVVE